jgi:RNA recognition motif-containing protein
VLENLRTSISADDIQTSNVFVANLPPHVTEQSLGTFFARMGPVGSVGVYIPFNLPFAYVGDKGQNHVATR